MLIFWLKSYQFLRCQRRIKSSLPTSKNISEFTRQVNLEDNSKIVMLNIFDMQLLKMRNTSHCMPCNQVK